MAINSDTITEVSAIGVMSSYLGIPAPVDITDVASDPDWSRAQQILASTTKEMLNKGLEENSDIDYTLSQEIDGTVLVPVGALRWVVKYDYDEKYVQRDGKVYDKILQTDVLNTDLVVDIVWNFTFESLPEIIKHYLSVKASFRLVSRLKGSDSVLNTIQQDLDDANYEFLRYQGRTNTMTLLDNYETNQISSRHLDYNFSFR